MADSGIGGVLPAELRQQLILANEFVLLTRLGREADAEHLLGLGIEHLLRRDGVRWELSPVAAEWERLLYVDAVRPGFSAMAGFLGRHAGVIHGAESASAKLAGWVGLWRGRRLWEGNLVRELVLHDDRHVERVDQLATQLAASLLLPTGRSRGVRLNASEAMVLGAAAWLHDWGHVGGFLSARISGAGDLVVTEPQDVRKLHGLVTQELLSPTWVGMHGIHEAATASTIGVLCAHHQGWTSCGSERPAPVPVLRADASRIVVQPLSLRDDVGRLVLDHSDELSLDLVSVRRLVALLRLADAGDVGRHRVPDHGPEKAAFLARCVQTQAMRVSLRLRWAHPHASGHLAAAAAAVERVAVEAKVYAERAARGERVGDVVRDMLSQLDREEFAELPQVVQLVDYVRFVDSTGPHYLRHWRVGAVSFAIEPTGSSSCDVDVLVRLLDQAHGREALHDLRDDIRRELRQGIAGSDIRSELAAAGLLFRDVVDADSGLRCPIPSP